MVWLLTWSRYRRNWRPFSSSIESITCFSISGHSLPNAVLIPRRTTSGSPASWISSEMTRPSDRSSSFDCATITASCFWSALSLIPPIALPVRVTHIVRPTLSASLPSPNSEWCSFASSSILLLVERRSSDGLVGVLDGEPSASPGILGILRRRPSEK